MTVSKYEVQFTYDNVPCNLILYDSDVYGEKGDKSKINVNGRNYAVAGESELPESVIKIFD